MNVFDKFFKKFAYKFEKGYPDMNNAQDVFFLQSILETLNVPNYDVILINEAAEDIKNELIDLGYAPEDIVVKSSKQIRLLTKGTERKSTMEKLLKDLEGSKYDMNFKGSSLGAIIADDGTAIIVKPKERQGGGSAGLDNEQMLIDSINQYTQDGPINITFKGENKTLTYANVIGAKGVGTDTAGGKKADVQLLGEGNVVIANISLKKANAEMWESADRRYKQLMLKLSKKLLDSPFPNVALRETDKKDIYRLYNPETGTDLGGLVITDLPDNENESIVFGTDTPKTIVIKHTFSSSDFSFSGSTLTINSGTIFTDLKDIEGTKYEPILVIRHDVTRTATNGLRPIVYNASHAYKDGKLAGGRQELTYAEAIK
jgi:hypothetical protein